MMNCLLLRNRLRSIISDCLDYDRDGTTNYRIYRANSRKSNLCSNNRAACCARLLIRSLLISRYSVITQAIEDIGESELDSTKWNQAHINQNGWIEPRWIHALCIHTETTRIVSAARTSGIQLYRIAFWTREVRINSGDLKLVLRKMPRLEFTTRISSRSYLGVTYITYRRIGS